MPFESVGLAGARRVDPLRVIPSPTSVTKQERRRAYHRKRSSAHLNFPQFKCDPSTVEPRSITTDCKSPSSDSDVTSTCTTFPSNLRSNSNQSLNIVSNPLSLLVLPDFNYDFDADSDINSIFNPEK